MNLKMIMAAAVIAGACTFTALGSGARVWQMPSRFPPPHP